MSTGAYQTSVLCPFYNNDYGPKHKITWEGIVDGSCIALIFQKRNDYKIHITTFCCKHYKKCEVYNVLMNAKYPDE